MRDIDQQLIFEAYTSVNNKTINESLLDHIKSKFGNFTTDVVRPYAIKAMQFIAKKDPQLAKKIAQAVQSKDINSLKNILQPGISELTQGAEVNNEAIMDIQNFLRTGLGKGIAGAILALAAFATVTGGLSAAGDGDINADGTIDSVELTGGVDGDISLQEFQHILDEAGVNVLTSSPEDIDTAVSDYMKKGNELEQSMKDALSNKMLKIKLKQKDPAAYDALIKIKGNMDIGNDPTQNMSQDQLQATQRLAQYVDGADSDLDLMKSLNNI